MFISRTNHLPTPPQRIISLVPSLTELLHDIDLEDQVIGITKFCVHPETWFRNKTRVGGTKNVNLDLIRSLHPDLIIANKEENVKEQIQTLASDFPVLVTDVNTLEEALDMIHVIGTVTHTSAKADNLVREIKDAFLTIPSYARMIKSVYVIWKNPYMTVGVDTFINSMMEKAGLQNVFDDDTRYPSVTAEEIAAKHPELILLSSEPYPFKERDMHELQEKLAQQGAICQIRLVDGEMFSWYGSRLLKAAKYLQELREQLTYPKSEKL
jgi:ABC-type Fe3+-hydroxamate transport system substrate-binding protein